VLYAVVLFLAALTPLVVGPDQPSPDRPSASLTMTFVVMGLGTVFNALTNRRNPASGLTPPILQAAAISVVPVVLLVLATEIGFLQRGLLTQELTGMQWLACIGLALALPIVIEASKWIRRARQPKAPAIDATRVVAPARALADLNRP
jgi:Ca2+-transporting ATPase